MCFIHLTFLLFILLLFFFSTLVSSVKFDAKKKNARLTAIRRAALEEVGWQGAAAAAAAQIYL